MKKVHDSTFLPEYRRATHSFGKLTQRKEKAMNIRLNAWGIALSAVGLAVVALGGPAKAQPQTKDEQIINSLYSKIQIAGGMDSATKGKVGTTTLIVLKPGRVLAFDAADADNDDVVKEEMAAMLNQLPAPAYFFEGKAQTLEDVWSAMLQFKEVPPRHAPEAEVKAAQAARDWLEAKAEPADPAAAGETNYERYMRYQAARDDAQWILQNETRSAKEAKTSLNPKFARDLTTANNFLTTRGNMNEVKAKLELFNQLSGKDPLVFWNDLRDDYTKFEKTNGPKKYHDIRTIPSIKTWKEAAGWTKITMDTSNSSDMSTATSVAGGASANGAYGVFSASGSGSFSKDTKTQTTTSDKTVVTLEVKRALIYRPWLNPVVFKLTSWKFGDAPLAKPYLTISSGVPIGTTVGRATSEVMPLLPTEILLARNLKIATGISNAQKDFLTSSMSAQAKASYGGMFSLNAHASSKTTTNNDKATVSNTGIEFPDIQIVGVYVDVLHKTPNPDPAMFAPAHK
jgi:hypothetical protein